MNQHIGQQFVIGLQGTSLLKDEADFIVKNNIGGIILMKRNCESPQQIRDLVAELQNLRHKQADKAPLFICIDMEGGRVARLGAPFTQWPAVAELGKLDSTSVAFKFASFMGTELRSVGINIDFAPCVDVLTNPRNTAIGDRSAGKDPELVSRVCSALVRGYIKSDVIPCAKHFPGHGNTLLDSHFELPVEEKSLAELDAVELVPFKKVFRARLDLVMTTHIMFPKLDPDWPATLSEKILTTLLRDQLRYRNLVITDDLDMKALTKHYDKALIPVRALQAGANLLLYCNEPESHLQAVGAVEKAVADKKLDAKVVAENHGKILELKKSRLAAPDPLPMDEVSRIVGHPDHIRLAKAIATGAVPQDLLTT